MGFDQPGVAARIAHHGVGEFIGVDETPTAKRLEGLIRKVMAESNYHERALYFKDVIARSKGLDVAADIVEEAYERTMTKGSPRSLPREKSGEACVSSLTGFASNTSDRQWELAREFMGERQDALRKWR